MEVIMLIILQTFFAKRAILKIGNIRSRDMFRLIACENIWWIMTCSILNTLTEFNTHNSAFCQYSRSIQYWVMHLHVSRQFCCVLGQNGAKIMIEQILVILLSGANCKNHFVAIFLNKQQKNENKNSHSFSYIWQDNLGMLNIFSNVFIVAVHL